MIGTAMGAIGRIPAGPLLLFAGILVLVRIASGPPPLPLGPDAVAAILFLYAPVFHYRRAGFPAWLRPRDARASIVTGAALAAGGAAVYLAFVRLPLPPSFRPDAAPLPPLGTFLAAQLFLVAVPEEVFFRGYLYDAFAEKGREPVIATSVLFALAHVAIHATPWRALTFVPGLAFGWARRRTGNILVPVALHLAYNALPFVAGAVP